MKRMAGVLLSGALIVGSAGTAGTLMGGTVAEAQQYGNGYNNGYRSTRPYDDRYDRNRYNGNDRHGDHGNYDRSRGGIGPGKGALIGAGGGALLGGLLGGGLKGALIGGGVGAGGGAIVGKIHQDNQRNDYRDYRDGYRR